MASYNIEDIKAIVNAEFVKGGKTLQERLIDFIDSTFNRTITQAVCEANW